MNVILNICKVTLEEGFMYAILALGLYITYSIRIFPIHFCGRDNALGSHLRPRIAHFARCESVAVPVD